MEGNLQIYQTLLEIKQDMGEMRSDIKHTSGKVMETVASLQGLEKKVDSLNESRTQAKGVVTGISVFVSGFVAILWASVQKYFFHN